jgi:protocatechuate 3,4-dioxygenase beta subunit
MTRRRLLALLLAPFLLGVVATVVLQQALPAAPGAPPPPPPAEPPPPAALPFRVAPAAPPSSADTRPSSFEGRVLSTATQAPIAGAELTFSRGGAADSARAGADGVFTFRPPTRGRWLLAAVSAPGYFPFAPEWGFSPVQFDAAPGHHVRGVDVFLTPSLQLDGLVVDEEGAPVPGAEVRLLGAGGRAALLPIPTRFTTDAAGRFRAAAPQGSLLEASKAGYYPGHTLVTVDVVVNGAVRIVLGAAWAGPEPAREALAGRVIGATGQPIAGALVEARKTHGWAYDGTAVAQAVTDAAGRFRFAGLDRSPHQLSVRAEGHAPGRLARVLPGGPEVTISLSPGGRLEGCVRAEDTGEPIAPFTVHVYFSTNGFRDVPDLSASVIDPSGCFALDELLPGATAVVVLAPRRAPSAVQRVDVPASPAAARLQVALAPGGTLAGVVRDEETGAPIAGAAVAAEAAPLPDELFVPVATTLAEATTGPDGTFTMGGMPDRVRVRVVAAGHHARTSLAVDVAPGGAGGPLEVDLRAVRTGDAGPVEPVGIGAVLVPEGDGLAVGGLRPGGSAEESGLNPGDELLVIDDHAVSDLGPGGAVEALRGPEGTPVFLRVRRGNSELDVQVPRRRAH